MATPPLRAVLFGNGFARTVILPCLRHVEGIRVAGIASPNRARAEETASLFGIETVSADHRELLERTRPDVAFIATPPHRHAEQAIDALAAGCHVVCEKPTALDAGESERMLAAARAAPGRRAWIDHELRFHPSRRAMLRIVQEGRLGRVLHASCVLRSPGRRDPSLPWTWWSDAAQGGGAWGAIGSHAVDALRVLLGEVAAARGTLSTVHGERIDPATGRPRPVTSDDLCAASLRFRSGVLATITLSLVEGERRHELSLSGERGWVRSVEQGPLEIGLSGAPAAREEPDWGMPGAGELAIPDTDWARSFLLLARALVRGIRGEDEAGEGIAATFEDGHRTQLVLDAVRRSARSESWIELPELPDLTGRES